MVLFWMLLFVVLLLFELHHMAFYALFVALGAFAAGIVALVAPNNIGLQTVVAISASIAGVIVVRPYVSQVFHRHRGGHVARGVHGGLVGQEAIALDEVGDLHQIGHVRLAGEKWLAVTGGPKIEAGRSVVVTAVRGTTLEVWPADLGASTASTPQLGTAPDGAEGTKS